MIPVIIPLHKLTPWEQKRIYNPWIPVNNICKEIVIFGVPNTLSWTLNWPKYTKIIRGMIFIPHVLFSIMIGLLISDAHIRIDLRAGQNPRLSFKQSIINFPVLWNVAMLFRHYLNALPYIDTTKIKGKFYFGVKFETRCYPVFHLLYDLFMFNGIKKISPELFHHFNAIVLAYWIMCDGLSAQYGLILCTDSYSIKDVVTLMNILMLKFNLKCNIHYNKGLPRIYIAAESMDNLRPIVKPYMLPFSLYKLYKGKRPVNKHLI